MIYLASPYSHADAMVMEDRYRRALDLMARLMLRGHIIYSPIVHSHEVALRMRRLGREVQTDRAYWWRHNRSILRHCSEIWVAEIDGWERSVGCFWEVCLAERIGIPARLVAPYGTRERPLSSAEFRVDDQLPGRPELLTSYQSAQS